MTTVGQLACALDGIAPAHLAEDWDNVGLIIGDYDETLGKGPVLVTIDLTAEVATEALERGASAVIAYHPPIFRAIKRLTGGSQKERGLLRCVRAGMAVLSPHTALDAAENGLAEWLVRTALGQGDEGRDLCALAPVSSGDDEVKLVTFVPTQHADAVREALAAAGAGVIGAYTHCSFQHSGSGTFLGDETTSPVVGERGRLERVGELRLEMVCPQRVLGRAIAALTSAHPYEEPAFDVYPLASKPRLGVGAGRAITLGTPASVGEIAGRVRTALGVDIVKVADAGRPVERVGACPGSGASLIASAIAEGCTCFVTGEMTHHEALAALDAGCSVVLAGHTHTERPYMPVLAERLRAVLAGVEFVVSERDRAPFIHRAG
ncbi:MAG: Nif3-like dinuclear metal center hexameric protein [Phycisphaerales bacterium]